MTFPRRPSPSAPSLECGSRRPRLSAYGIALVALVACAGASWTGTNADAAEPFAPTAKQSKQAGEIVRALREIAYRDLQIDDALSRRIFDRYLDRLDPSRMFLLQRDVNEFQRYATKLDDGLMRGELAAPFEIFNRFQQRRKTLTEGLLTWLDDLESLRFDTDEAIRIDREEAPWPTDLDEAEALWRKRFKNDVLNLRLADKEADEIEETLGKRYRDRLLRINQVNGGDVFRIFMNVVTSCYGPHTEYYPPHDAENFDITMSLTVHGIGALLGADGEYCRVDQVIPGGPADRDGRLRATDRIVAVGQGEHGEMVDVVGWRVDEIVGKIRGEKGSVVRLAVLNADVSDRALSREIRLVRDEVQLSEREAQKRVIERVRAGRTYKVGVVELPAFYMDFEAARRGDPDYTSTTRDVARLVTELKREGVDGIVIDLRGNGGGSLVEAHELSSMFLGAGPVVQVRNVRGKVDVLGSEEGRPLYDGPLAVVVDRVSASASEIFAGVMFDTGRALVVGQRTFGKGTVQGLARIGDGRLKVTQAKFYRVTGASTQHAGVDPHLLLPPLYDHDEIGESALDDALPWDTVDPVRHPRDPSIEQNLGELRRRHMTRTAADPDFRLIRERLDYSEKNERDYLSLNEETRRAEQRTTEQDLLAMENRRRVAEGLDPVESLDDVEPRPDDEADPYVVEAGDILLDYIELTSPRRSY